ncbi:hypothetical protein CVS40_11162 [Lucilia cuprina]|nr:hypothetical protein CVS40_11162 [Lucilia cuprina]
MDCISRNCNISGDERMVFCWLCLGNYHLKCNGLKARDADALSDKTKNIQWTCPNCRIIGIEFYKFFKSYKTEFDEIKKDFSTLQGKLSKYGELFSKFTNLDNFAVSPKPKRKRTTKASSTSPKDSNVAAPNQFAVTQPINPNPTNQFAVTQQMNEKQTNLGLTPKPFNVTAFSSSNIPTYTNVVSDQTVNKAYH